MFLSTYVNKVDKKGRVSVPAVFRTALAEQKFQGVVLIKSASSNSIDGFGMDMMEELCTRLDNFDVFSDAQDDLATSIFGDAVQLPFDGDGRIVLPADLMKHADIAEQAAFVGMGRKFQIWEPVALSERKSSARTAIKQKGLTLPKGGA